MGANTVNTILEGLSPKLRYLMDGEVLMAIVSNLSPERICKSFFEIPVSILGTLNQSGL